MEYSRKDLEKHLQEEHKVSPFSEYLKEIVYGGNDGIVTTFAVVAGFAGAQGDPDIVPLGYMAVLLFGLANLFADGASMGLGNFLSIRSEKDRYRQERKKEEYEIEHNPYMEQAETKELLMARGFSETDASELVRIYSQNKEYWADFMMRYELEMAEPTENPLFTGLATFLAFTIFGFIPLVPYILFATHPDTFQLAVGFTFFALVLLGILRWLVTKESILRSIGEIVLVGGISAAVAYFVGTFFRM